MRKFIVLFFILTIAGLQAEVSLRNLIACDKVLCLDRLTTATTEELWDSFLEVQADFFFEPEYRWIASQLCWQEANNILDLGSGNGAFLFNLAKRFQEKSFYGIDKTPASVHQANNRYSRNGLAFQEGDAEVFNEQLSNSAEIVRHGSNLMKNGYHKAIKNLPTFKLVFP